MILYFTGTGNSKFVADALAEKLNDKIVSINDIIKFNQEKVFKSKKPYVIVSPIYAWQLPKVVVNFIERASFRVSNKVYVVTTMGGSSGTCNESCKKLFTAKGMEFMGFRGVVMPDNYVVASKMADDKTVRQIIGKALPEIFEIAKIIKADLKLEKKEKDKAVSGLLSGVVNKMFYKYSVTDSNYVVNDDCIGCGLCEKLCPLNNISLTDGKPVFGGRCTACYACIQHCPEEAINIKGKTENHGRYVCPEYRMLCPEYKK